MKSIKLLTVVLAIFMMIFVAGAVGYSSNPNTNFVLDVKENLSKDSIVANINQTPITEGYFLSKVAVAELKINKFKNIKEKGKMKDAPLELRDKLDETIKMGAKKWAWEQIKFEVAIMEEAKAKNIIVTEEEIKNQKEIWEAAMKEAEILLKEGKPVAGDLEQIDLLQELGSDVYWNEYFPSEAKCKLLKLKLHQDNQFKNKNDFDAYIIENAKKLNIKVLNPSIQSLL